MTQRVGNKVIFGKTFLVTDLPGALACIHQVKKAGYEEIDLDFTCCNVALPVASVGLCAQIMRLRLEGLDFSLQLPINATLSRHFLNANWAHLIAPDAYPVSSFKGFTIFPATHFTDYAGQKGAVDRIVTGILGAVPGLSRTALAALEWSVNEITDNVLVHSQSTIGGIVQMSMFERTTKRIAYIVADAGVGIPRTLRQAHPEFNSDTLALSQSIKEGVTRDASFGQGNGLYGSYEVCSRSKGIFHLQSGHAKLTFNTHGLQVLTEKVPFEGSLLEAQINLTDPKLLEQALNFKGVVHTLCDFVETRYEHETDNIATFIMKNESTSFGSRLAGTPVRNRLSNLIDMCTNQRIVIDFADMPLPSSSFSDEVFGKLFVALGPMKFAQRLEFRNLSGVIQQLIDKAIAQRMSQPVKQ